MDLPPLPRWFWLLPVLATAAWWPLGAYWASDDFLALWYAQDFGRVLDDFAGPQYGATDVWWFYRPLITLSFWLDLQIGGVDAFVGHLSNVLAHGLSALLVGLLWRRFVGEGAAFSAGLLWALMASHVGSVSWAVGRVDSHTTVWCLLTLWLALRANERRAETGTSARWPMVLTTVAALMSKELALVVPALATFLCALQGPGERAGARVRGALCTTWPLWLLLVLYLPFRVVVLGHFGGYAASSYEPLPMLRGLAVILFDLLVPLRWIGMPTADGPVPRWLWLLSAALPVVIAVLVTAVRRPRLMAALLVAFAIAVVPMSGFFRSADNPHNLRYYYLPAAALVGLVVAGGRWAIVAVLLAWAWPLVAVRTAQHLADRESAAMHAALLREAKDGAESPMFVAGLPHANAAGTAVQLHFGIDRMLRPPFHEPGLQLFAWRPLADLAGIQHLEVPGEPPFQLPLGSTWWFVDRTALGRAPAAPPLPELEVTGAVDGVFDLTTDRLDTLIEVADAARVSGSATFGLLTPGVRPMAYRVTMFTANGYLSCLTWDNEHGDGTDGRLDMLRFFAGDERAPNALPAQLSTQLRLDIGDALIVPTTIDLVPEFPTLIEAGAMRGAFFVPSHRARHLITFRFDRGYPGWVRRARGAER